MLLEFYQNLPLHFNPVAFTIGSFSVRWYGLSYLISFAAGYLLLSWRIKNGEADHIVSIPAAEFSSPKQINEKSDLLVINYRLSFLMDFLLVSFFATLFGGRIGYVIFYNLAYYLANPLAIISPYDQAGNLIGFFGMSYHGALIGVLLSSGIFLRAKKIDFLSWADFVIPAVAFGYFFGRLGNFFNGELYGRITSTFWGMYFTTDPSALRHPSQLYEAVLEGLAVFILLWNLRQKKFKKGTLLAIYFGAYGFFRFLVEYFRQPDPQIGLIFEIFTMGQVLSLLMILLSALMFFKTKRS